MIQIINTLAKKWGKKKTITPNIKRKLTKRKRIIDMFFSKLFIDGTSSIYFKNKNQEPLSRYIVYCHDVPGLLAYKKLVEDEGNENEEEINVVGIDDGKNLLKIVFNWARIGKSSNKSKAMGPKRCLVIAAVAQVPETYWNMQVLIELTGLNEIKFKLSQDLKLINIIIGITTFSSKYPCPYGHCYKDEKTGLWNKGEDRTFRNLSEMQKKWCETTGENRSRLKEFMNCEFAPLITIPNPDTPVIHLIPPPPLHLILLGNAVKIAYFT